MAGSLEVAAYLRVAAYAIAFFDYLQTLPAEYRLYARQKGPFNLSTACILFIIVRYVGLATLIVSNTGFFYHGFSPEACDRYFWMAPVLKLILYMTSQIILGLRTYAVSHKSRPVLYILIILFIVCCVPEFLSTFWKRVRSQTHGSCNSGNPPGVHIAALYYVGGLLFDAVTMIITSWYLWKFSSSSRSSFSQLTRMMLRDGLMYFIALSAMNVVNIIFFQNPQTVVQSSAVSLGYTSTMIFSGRFILNLSEHVRDGFSGDQDHSSRTPRTPITPGFRTRGETMNGSEPPLVVSVMKNVITMNDMGKDDGEPRSASKNGSQWAMA